MDNYMMSLMAAAEELAAHKEALGDYDMQYEVCAKYGVFLDCITEDELEYLSTLIRDFM